MRNCTSLMSSPMRRMPCHFARRRRIFSPVDEIDPTYFVIILCARDWTEMQYAPTWGWRDGDTTSALGLDVVKWHNFVGNLQFLTSWRSGLNITNNVMWTSHMDVPTGIIHPFLRHNRGGRSARRTRASPIDRIHRMHRSSRSSRVH